MLDPGLKNRLRDALLRLPGIDSFGARTALLSGIPVSLNRAENNAFVDVTNILSQLDGLGRLDNGERPIVILAHNAGQVVPRPELGRDLKTLERDIEKSYGEEELSPDVSTIPEALIFGGPGEWVTSAFLENAKRVGACVARLRVPRIENGEEVRPAG